MSSLTWQGFALEDALGGSWQAGPASAGWMGCLAVQPSCDKLSVECGALQQTATLVVTTFDMLWSYFTGLWPPLQVVATLPQTQRPPWLWQRVTNSEATCLLCLNTTLVVTTSLLQKQKTLSTRNSGTRGAREDLRPVLEFRIYARQNAGTGGTIGQTVDVDQCVFLTRDIDWLANMACRPIYAKSGLSDNLESA